MEEKNNQEVKEIIKDNQSKDQQLEETEKKTYTLEEAVEIATNTQKGISQLVGNYNQRMNEIEEKIQEVIDKTNLQTGAKEGEDEYLTVGKLREILKEDTEAKINEKNQADKYIETALTQLKAENVISSKEQEDELINYALKIKEPDLLKAAERWQEIKQTKEEAKKEAAKTKVKQEEGSTVGTSSKTTGGEQGVDYRKIRSMDWSDFA